MVKGLLVSDPAQGWLRERDIAAACDPLDEEFVLAEAMVRARADAAMTQVDVARAMGTTQAAVARLESGRTMPSTRTLQRFAEATGTRLSIRFEKSATKRPVS